MTPDLMRNLATAFQLPPDFFDQIFSPDQTFPPKPDTTLPPATRPPPSPSPMDPGPRLPRSPLDLMGGPMGAPAPNGGPMMGGPGGPPPALMALMGMLGRGR